MIKRVLTLVVPVAMLILNAGCVGVTFSAIDPETLMGSGPMTTMEYTVDQYTALEIYSEGEIELYYKAEQSDKVVVELQENLAENFSISVKDGVLAIESDKRFKTDKDKTPKLYISAPKLDGITVGGALSIKQADAIKADSFTLDISGVSSGDLSLEVGALNAEVSGACDFTLSGSADEAVIRTSGASSIDALELQTRKSSVEISGAGTISIACSETLDINVNGTGSVSYKGNPQVTQNIGGAVSVKRLD